MRRLALINAIQGLLDDGRTGLNRDHTIKDLIEHLDDPKSVADLGPDERESVVAYINNRREQVRHDDRDGAILLEDLGREIEAGKHVKREIHGS